MYPIVSKLDSNSERIPDRQAFVFLDNNAEEAASLSFIELRVNAIAIAEWLISQTDRGDRVLLCFAPGLDYVKALYGCFYAGVVAVPLYPPHRIRKDERIASVISDCSPRIVLTDPSSKATLSTYFNGSIADLESILPDNIERELGSPNLRESQLGNTAFLQYTSGSTGDPKGVTVDHQNIVANLESLIEAVHCTEEDVFVNWLPTYHDLGLINTILLPVYLGSLTVLMAPASFVSNPYLWFKAIDKYRGSICGGPNFSFDLCIEKLDIKTIQDLDLSSWRIAFNAAERVNGRTIEEFSTKFEDIGFSPTAFYPSYGMAEATAFLTGGDANALPRIEGFDKNGLSRNRVLPCNDTDPDTLRLVGCGFVQSGHDLVIANPETKEVLGDDEIGEILVRGPSIAGGYWENPAVSRAEFSNALKGVSGDPWLRTGDLGFLYQGELFITGRIKELIIIAGQNYYPADIENVVQDSHPMLKRGGGAAFSILDGNNEKLVVVQEVTRAALRKNSWNELADAIARSVLETFLLTIHELVLVKTNSVKKTSSGKIRRNYCKSEYMKGGLAVLDRFASGSVSQTHSEDFSLPAFSKKLISILGETTNLDGIDVNKDFISLGMDSIALTRIAARLNESYGTRFSVKDLLEYSSIGKLLQALEGRGISKTQNQLIKSCGRQSVENREFPLSSGQQRLWFVSKLADSTALFNEYAIFEITGSLDINALEKSILGGIAKHESLRTVFSESEGIPTQRISDNIRLDFENLHVEDIEIAKTQAAQDSGFQFDFTNGPLIRVRLYTVLVDRHVLSIVLPHILIDAGSMSIFCRELSDQYSAAIQNRVEKPSPLTVRYSDYVNWQEKYFQSETYLEHLELWKQYLSGSPQLHSLPLDYQRPVRLGYKGEVLEVEVSGSLLKALRRECTENRVTLFMYLHAALSLLISKYGATNDILIGTAIEGRTQKLTEDLVGFFVNDIALRIRIDQSWTFAELLEACKESLLNAFEIQDVPFDHVVDQICPTRSLSHNPLIQIKLDLLDSDYRKLELEGVNSHLVSDLGKEARYELYVRAIEDKDQNKLTIMFQYNTELFTASSIDNLSFNFVELMSKVLDLMNEPVGSLELVSESEKKNIDSDFEALATRSTVSICAHHVFENVAAEKPNNIVLYEGDEAISYQQLNERANQLARLLLAVGAAPNVLVGLCVNEGAEILTGILGIMKSGAAYVPINPNTPESRVEEILRSASIEIVVTEQDILCKFGFADCRKIPIDSESFDSLLGNYPIENIEQNEQIVDPTDLAYAIFTSGTMGTQKGVLLDHSSLVSSTESRFQYYRDVPECFAVFSSYSFDSSIAGIFWSLFSGGSLCFIESGVRLNLNSLQSLFESRDITHMLLLPRLYREIVNVGMRPSGALKTVIVAGEECDRATIQAHFSDSQWSHAKLFNEYGPTEACVWATAFDCGEYSSGVVPIGSSIDHTGIVILNAFDKLVPKGGIGEICIAADSLARGYVNDPRTTASSFIRYKFADRETLIYKTGDMGRFSYKGDVEFVGRKDSQVKVRGFRIDLAEIENQILLQDIVDDCAVAKNSRFGEMLVAYAVLNPDQDIENLSREVRITSKLKDGISHNLPEYMVPAVWIFLDEIPTSQNGKVDRSALPEPESKDIQKNQYAAPRTDLEKTLSKIWASFLRVEKVGLDDNFFEMGGDSIVSIQVVSEARKHGIELTVEKIFEEQTIRKLSTHAETGETRQREIESPEGKLCLLPMQKIFFSWNLPAANHFSQAILLETEKDIQPEELRKAIKLIFSRHDGLRVKFELIDDQCYEATYEPYTDEMVDRVLSVVDLSDCDTSLWKHELEVACKNSHQQFSLHNPPLFKVTLIKSSINGDKLFLVAHHLIMDAVSWRIIISDLGMVLAQLHEGKIASLPVRTSTLKEWASRLYREYDSGKTEEKIYWLDLDKSIASGLDKRFLERFGEANLAFESSTSFSPEETGLFLDSLAHVFDISTNELLVSGLLLALNRWVGPDSVNLELESHGRRHGFDDVDISDTVGWFTSVYPIRFELGHMNTVNSLMFHVKNALRSVPGSGFGYGVLRGIDQNSEFYRHATLADRNKINLNFLGEIDNISAAGTGISIARDSISYQVNTGIELPYMMMIVGRISSGRLAFDISCRPGTFSKKDIDQFSVLFRETLLECIDANVGQHLNNVRKRTLTKTELGDQDSQKKVGFLL